MARPEAGRFNPERAEATAPPERAGASAGERGRGAWRPLSDPVHRGPQGGRHSSPRIVAGRSRRHIQGALRAAAAAGVREEEGEGGS